MAVSDNLSRARSENGLDQDDVASALGVSRAMVSYWESGRREPNDAQLVALSRLLRWSVAALRGAEEPSSVPDVASMLLRGADREVPDGALAALRDFVAFLDAYAQLAEMSEARIPGLHQSPFVSGSGFDSADDARRKAEEVRAHLRMGLGPVGDLDEVCERLGLTVYRAPLGANLQTTISGAFYHHPVVGFAILVNLDMTPGRRRFTVAHEVAHALFHSGTAEYVISTATKSPRERFADAFAGEFLMPTEGIRSLMEEKGFGVRLDDPAQVISIQRYFDVSYVTALVRLRQARFLSQASFDRFQALHPVRLARSLGYDIGDEEHRGQPHLWRLERFPPRFRWLLRRVVQDEVVSAPTAAALTGLTFDEVVDLCSRDIEVEPLAEDRTELEEFTDSGILNHGA